MAWKLIVDRKPSRHSGGMRVEIANIHRSPTPVAGDEFWDMINGDPIKVRVFGVRTFPVKMSGTATEGVHHVDAREI